MWRKHNKGQNIFEEILKVSQAAASDGNIFQVAPNDNNDLPFFTRAVDHCNCATIGPFAYKLSWT